MGRAIKWFKGLFGMKTAESSNSGDRKRFNPVHSPDLCHNPTTIPPNISPAEAAWLKSFYSETEKEQSKHAIAVAAATAAAADAAVAAAQAAVAVVRLTSHGRGTMFGGGRERWAAVKIQSVFRAHLARKAHRALRGLVKLQALVRGYLVRKQATATLHSIQAMIRAQSSLRSCRNRSLKENRARKSTEKFQIDDLRSEQAVSVHSRRLSASFDNVSNNFDENLKIVEVDTGGRPKSRSRRTNADFLANPFYQTGSSPVPARLSIPETRYFQETTEWGLIGDECRFSTAHSTPRFVNPGGSNGPATPAKSVCGGGNGFFRGYMGFPNYMANTQSFKAKLRSHSAPKQRPEVGPKRRLSLNEMMMESRSSLSGARMQRSCSQVQDAVNFKNAVVGKLDRWSEYGG